MTLERVTVDLARAFEPSQIYVACKSLFERFVSLACTDSPASKSREVVARSDCHCAAQESKPWRRKRTSQRVHADSLSKATSYSSLIFAHSYDRMYILRLAPVPISLCK